MSKTNEPEQKFTEEQLANIIEFGEVLRGIHNRLISEGYVIKAGKVTKNGKEVMRP